jgi:cytochrome P450
MPGIAGSSLPPGPRLPRRLQGLALALRPASFIDACHRRYGDVVVFRGWDGCTAMVFDPELVKQVLQAPPGRLRAGKARSELAPVVGERSVVVLDGPEHIRQRRLLLPSFHGERMRAYEAMIREATDRAIEAWPVNRPFTLLPSMQSLTLDVIARVVFGVDDAVRAKELKGRLRRIVDPAPDRLRQILPAMTSRRSNGGASPRSDARLRLVDELLYEEISRRRAALDLCERDDLLSVLLFSRDETGQAMSDEELRDELVTLLVAGYETTALALAWAFELLLRDRPVLKRVLDELSDGADGYLDAAIKETLRLRPLGPGVSRVVCDEPYELGGYLIPPGARIQAPIAAIHRRPDLYPEPLAFRPERFLGPEAPDQHAWLPFGGGTRRCLGASFATFEMKLVIGRVLERARLGLVGRRLGRNVRKGIMLRRGVMFAPQKGVRVVQLSPPECATGRRP